MSRRESNIFEGPDNGAPDAAGVDGSPQTYPQSGHMDVPGWRVKYVGKGIWELRPDTANHPDKLAMTGAAVTIDAYIPISHRLIRLEWKHLDENLVDGTDATAAVFNRDDYEPLAGILWRLYYEAASASSTTVVPFGEGYEYYRCRYQLSFNTTAGDWIIPILWLQEIKP